MTAWAQSASPAITISGGSAVTEGTAATFTVTASPAPTDALTINLSVSDGTGDFLGSTPPTTVTIPANMATATLSVPTVNDNTDEDNGVITVTLSAGTGYTIADPAPSAMVTVNDNDDAPVTPTVTLSLNGVTTIAENRGSVTVTMTLSSSPASLIRIPIMTGGTATIRSASDLNDYSIGTGSVGFSAGTTFLSFNFTVDTFADNKVEGDETIILSIDASSIDGVDNGATTSVTLTIIDDNEVLPVITISGGSAVTEGTAATFTLTANPAPTDALTVSLSVSDGIGNFLGSSPPATAMFTANSGTATLTVPTVDDSTDEADGSVTVTLSSSTAYTLGSPAIAFVTVNDNDGAPVPAITISGGSAVTEGTAATFTVTASPAPVGTLTVNFSASNGSGDFLGTNPPTSVTFTATEATATVSVPTNDDSTDEPNGSVTVTLSAGSGYTLGSTTSASVTVNDNDDAPVAVPTITISGGPAVTEGTAATFTISASPAPVGTLTVNLSASNGGGVFLGTNPPTTVVFTANSGTATLTVPTVDDSTDEANGFVTVTLSAGSGYTLGSTTSASVTVNDNDDAPVAVPTITISGGPAVTEGTAATFTVTASPAPVGTLTVSLSASNGSGVFLGTNPPTTVVFTANSGTATLTVPTVDDSTDERHGSVTVTLSAGSGYTLGGTTSASVTVNDNDAGDFDIQTSMIESSITTEVAEILDIAAMGNSIEAIGEQFSFFQ